MLMQHKRTYVKDAVTIQVNPKSKSFQPNAALITTHIGPASLTVMGGKIRSNLMLIRTRFGSLGPAVTPAELIG